MENVRKYQDVKLIAMNNKQDEKKFIKQIHKTLLNILDSLEIHL